MVGRLPLKEDTPGSNPGSATLAKTHPDSYYRLMPETIKAHEKLEIGNQIVIFIGPEGSGKTTHAAKLAQSAAKPYISTSEILHYLAKHDSGPLGDECRIMFATHTYLKGETLIRICQDRFSQADTANGFILDGGLRTIEETQVFPQTLLAANLDLPVTVIYLPLPQEISLERLVTGHQARLRPDDTETAVNSRLDKFYLNLEARLAFIQAQTNWSLVSISAAASTDVVYTNICHHFRP